MNQVKKTSPVLETVSVSAVRRAAQEVEGAPDRDADVGAGAACVGLGQARERLARV